MLTQESVLTALRNVKYPGYNRDIVSFGLVKEVQIDGSAVGILIELTSPNAEVGQQIADAARLVLREQFSGLIDAHVQVKMPAPQQAGASAPGLTQKSRIAGLNKIIAVASGKGGVGKSTCSANIACALGQLGQRVGLLDCDIYGPSIPLMMGVRGKPMVSDTELLVPPVAHQIKVMSMGLLLNDDQPVIWRGPMIQKTIHQFIHQVAWGELDFLIVDLPPGTGDAQLSLCQTVPLDGGVIVTTPQEASLGVVRKGIAMFEKVNVPILGIVENMSYFTAPDGSRVEIFGHGGGQREAARRGVPFLGEVPIFQEIRIGGDSGVPVVISARQGAPAQCFVRVAKALITC